MFLFNPLHVTRRGVYSTCKIADDAATGYRQEQVGGAALGHAPSSRRHMSHVRTLHQFSVHSEAYQRLSWEALKKSIHGLINKVSDLPAQCLVLPARLNFQQVLQQEVGFSRPD